ncbi:MAG TPA: hypothetical protein VFH03_18205 [Actinoplanes sp.]|nr:hypothetical protein [Actinoplanes sp.]
MKDPIGRRRDRLSAEVRRNREGGHRFPTWLLALVVAVLAAGWLYLVITG